MIINNFQVNIKFPILLSYLLLSLLLPPIAPEEEGPNTASADARNRRAELFSINFEATDKPKLRIAYDI